MTEKIYRKLTLPQVIVRRLERALFNFITRKGLSIFLRGKDIISIDPQVYGVWEENLTTLIGEYAEEGHSDFFIDVGANIGLTSCQNGNVFKRTICFEPNPLCVNILKTNLSICLDEEKFTIFEFALGRDEGSFDLYIPKNNWGGAFVKNHDNAYSERTLSLKDGFEDFDSRNYSIKKVEVKNGALVFSNLFDDLVRGGAEKGVIKIDVEGFERTVLSSIAESLPSSLDVSIVFENWDDNLDMKKVADAFSARHVVCKKFVRTIADSKKLSTKQIFKFLMFGDVTSITDCNNVDSLIGNIILEIS